MSHQNRNWRYQFSQPPGKNLDWNGVDPICGGALKLSINDYLSPRQWARVAQPWVDLSRPERVKAHSALVVNLWENPPRDIDELVRAHAIHGGMHRLFEAGIIVAARSRSRSRANAEKESIQLINDLKEGIANPDSGLEIPDAYKELLTGSFFDTSGLELDEEALQELLESDVLGQGADLTDVSGGNGLTGVTHTGLVPAGAAAG